MVAKTDIGKVLTGTVPAIENVMGGEIKIAGMKIPSNIDTRGKKRDEGDKGDLDLIKRLTALMAAAKVKTGDVGSWIINGRYENGAPLKDGDVGKEHINMNSEFQVVMREIGIVLANTSVEGLRGVKNGTGAAAADANRLGKLIGDQLEK